MLDLILIVVVAAFAVSGYRQGFIVGVLSFFALFQLAGPALRKLWSLPRKPKAVMPPPPASGPPLALAVALSPQSAF